jgi:hypothetical protein
MIPTLPFGLSPSKLERPLALRYRRVGLSLSKPCFAAGDNL